MAHWQRSRLFSEKGGENNKITTASRSSLLLLVQREYWSGVEGCQKKNWQDRTGIFRLFTPSVAATPLLLLSSIFCQPPPHVVASVAASLPAFYPFYDLSCCLCCCPFSTLAEASFAVCPLPLLLILFQPALYPCSGLCCCQPSTTAVASGDASPLPRL